MRNIRNVLVYGANGVQGGAISRELVEQGFQVRAAVRSAARAAPLRARGVELAVLDLGDPETLHASHHGIDAVVLTLPLEWESATVLGWLKHVLAAAKANAVELVVFNAGTRFPEAPTNVPAFELRRAAEALLRDADLPHIVLRPPFFLENLLNPALVLGMTEGGVLRYPVPASTPVAWLCADDLGVYAAAALRRHDLAGRAFDIGGPQVLTGHGLAAQLSTAIGRPIAYEPLSPDLFEASLLPIFGAAVAHGIAKSYYWLAEHPHTELCAGTSPELERELARPLVGVEAWARARTWDSRPPEQT
jgi:NAD(P)H dehydrogenase (quinone)